MRKALAPVALVALLALDRLKPAATIENATLSLVIALAFGFGVWMYVSDWLDDVLEA